MAVAVVSSEDHFSDHIDIEPEWTSDKMNVLAANNPTEDIAVLLFVQTC